MTELTTVGPESFGRESLRDLIERAEPPVVTISHPTDRAAVDPSANETPLKNALRTAGEELDERGHAVDELLAPAEELLSRGLKGGLDGQVLHLWPSGAVRHVTAYRVPERVEIAAAPHVLPLLPGLATQGSFAILGVSPDQVRLLRATATTVEEVDLSAADVPRSIEDLPGGDDESPAISHRSAGRAGDPSLFHGHADERREEVQFERLFREVEQGVRRILGDSPQPLVLAGVQENRLRFARLAEHLAPLADGIDGDPADQTADELRDAAWPIAAAVLRQPIDDLRSSFAEDHAAGLATADVSELLAAAVQGKVGTALLAEDERVWGKVDDHGLGVTEMHTGDPRPDDEDLLERAARTTFEFGGDVYAVPQRELPEPGSPVAARLRF